MRPLACLLALTTTACATTHERGEAELHIVAGDDARAWRWSVRDEAGKHRCTLPCDLVVEGSKQLDVVGRNEVGSAFATVPTDLPPGAYTVTLGAPKEQLTLPLALGGAGLAFVVAGAALELPQCVGPDAGSLGYAVPSDCPRKDAGTMLLTTSLVLFGSAALVLILGRPIAPVTVAREPAFYR